MMKQPVEQCRGKNLISTEQTSPPSKAGIRRQDDRAMNISGSNQLKELMSLFLGKLGIAHFIDDQQTRRDVATQTLPHQAGM
jgi:hypothetical protein